MSKFMLKQSTLQANYTLCILKLFLNEYKLFQIQVWLKKDVLLLDQQLSKDLIYTMIKREAMEMQQGFKETLYKKEMQKYAKEAFFILCELLSIQKPIEAILKPIEQTKLLDEMILMKYKSKPMYVRMHLRKNLRIPLLLTERNESYYKEKCEKSKVTQENLEKLNVLVMDDSQSQQLEENSDNLSNQEKIIKYYKQIQSNDTPNILSINEQKSKSFVKAQQPKYMRSLMFPYQRQGLQWMLYKERLIEEHDLYEEQVIIQSDRKLSKMWCQIMLPDRSELYLNEFSGQISEEFIAFQESKGGIIGDQMGLGKTIMSIGLVLAAQELQQQEIEPEGRKKRIKGELCKAKTLLVVQLSVMNHWVSEFERHTLANSVQLYEYYTAQSRETRNLQLDVYDVVITTYGILSRDYNKNGKLFQQKWERVILDEAHIIKGRGTQCFKAAYNLNTDCRWCLTGTPLQNCLDDLFSLFHFLKIDTFSDYFWFNTYINKQPNKQHVFSLLHKILEPILLRRTKQSTYSNGQQMLELPPKNYEVIRVQMSESEFEGTEKQKKRYCVISL